MKHRGTEYKKLSKRGKRHKVNDANKSIRIINVNRKNPVRKVWILFPTR